MEKSNTQQIIEHYIKNDSNLDSDITRLLAKLKQHNLLRKDILIIGNTVIDQEFACSSGVDYLNVNEFM